MRLAVCSATVCASLVLVLAGCGGCGTPEEVGTLPVVPSRLFATTTDSASPRAEAVVELDPETGNELNRFALPEATPSGYGFDGLAFDGTSLWFITGDGTGTLYELDPDTGAVIDADPIAPAPGGAGTFDGLAALDGRIFISDGNAFVLVFDPGSDTVVGSYDVAGLNADITSISGGVAGFASPGGVVVTDVGTGRMYEVDASTGVLRGFSTLGSTLQQPPTGATVVSGEIYIAMGSGARYDVYTRAGTFLRSVNLPYEISALGGNG